MKRFGRRRFLGALAGSVALWPFRKLFGVVQPGPAAGPGGRRLKAAIVYYSGSGSTAKVAKAIHRGMSASTDCDLLRIKKADPKKMARYDLIGLGGPIWYFRETGNLKAFVWKMPEMPGKPVFLFCAHGSEPIGFFNSLGESVMKKKMKIIGWNDWFGSVLHVLHMPKPYLTDGHPDAKDLADAESFGREMADRGRRYLAGDMAGIPEIPQGTDVDPLWIRHDLPEAQHGPGPKIGSAYGDGVDPSVAAAGVAPAVLGSGAGPKSAAQPVPAAMGAPAAKGSFGDAGFRPGAEWGSRGASSRSGGGPGGSGGGPGGAPGGFDPRSAPKVFPEVNLNKCVYPRCDACIFACPVDAIDFTLAAAVRSAGGRLEIKEACIHCGLCERVCYYDAMVYEPKVMPKTEHKYDMAKCTYPKCTLCVDYCPMDCIDFATSPPKIHTNCEGCDVCWAVCPTDAISIPNLAQNHLLLRMKDGSHPFAHNVDEYEKVGRFRRLVPFSQIGFDHPVFLNKNAPRMAFHDDDEATYCDTNCKVDKLHG